MPVKFTEAFKINPLVLKELGVFDAILDVDTRVFFDPARISLTTAPEFIGAKEKIEQYCSDIITLLSHSKNTGDMYCRGNGAVVGEQSLGSGLIVVRTHQKQSVHTQLFCGPAQGDGMLRTVASGSRNDPALIPYIFLCTAEQLQLFGIGQGRGLSGGSADYNGPDSGIQLKLQQPLQHGIIYFAPKKRGHQCGADTGEKWFSIHMHPSGISLCGVRLFCLLQKIRN